MFQLTRTLATISASASVPTIIMQFENEGQQDKLLECKNNEKTSVYFFYISTKLIPCRIIKYSEKYCNPHSVTIKEKENSERTLG